MAVGFGWLALSTASAIYGFSQTSNCRAGKEELSARLNRLPPPQSWPPPGAQPVTPPASSPAKTGTPPVAVPINPASFEGCGKDMDCKGARVCNSNHQCVAPTVNDAVK